MLEEALLNIGLQEGIFAGLFIWLFLKQLKQSEVREEKLYNFLDEMKVEFAKLVGSYETLSNDVHEIKSELQQTKKVTIKKEGNTDEITIN